MKTILIVDDEDKIRNIYGRHLEAYGFKVLGAADTVEADAVLKEQHVDLVLLDINMRGMDGIETLKNIKAIDKDIVVIMVTGEKDDDIINKAFDAGADDYITKPLSLEYLDKVVLLKFINLQIKDLGKI